MVRECELAYITRAGVEVGVASTKAFTTQLAALFLLTLALAQTRGLLTEAGSRTPQGDAPPAGCAAERAGAGAQIIAWAEAFARRENALFLGRGCTTRSRWKARSSSRRSPTSTPRPIRRRTEARPAGAGDGPDAGGDVAPNDALVEKLKSNMQEVRARGGQLYVFADGDSRITSAEGLHVIRMPEHYGVLSPILHVVPLQLLSYHTALARGTDVDKPRNLAKSVTVE
jgi:glucosamine--fructose-6-phosphate aminotransferase (isomerizing)